jgi:hypothetical protein
MIAAGIDTSQYKCHSTRAASTSHLASKHFDLKNIMLAAGWTREEHFSVFITLILLHLTLEVPLWTRYRKLLLLLTICCYTCYIL